MPAAPQPGFVAQDMTEYEHHRALQALSNKLDVPYDATLRQVLLEGSRSPILPPKQTRKHPGYIRNESGGLFTT